MSQQTVGKLLEEYLYARDSAGEHGTFDRDGARRTQNLRDRLLVNYSPLVKYVVGKISARAVHPTRQEELMSSGVLGLLNAIETFDPGREAKFQTYAISKIRWAILDELRREDRVSRRIRARAKEMERAKDRLTQRMRRTPTEDEVAGELGIGLKEYRTFLRQYSQSQADSLEANVGAEPGSPTLERQVSSGEEDPAETLERQEIREQLVAAIVELNERERNIITLYFYEGLTLREIGQALHLTEGRISQIMSRTLEKLRRVLRVEDFALHGF